MTRTPERPHRGDALGAGAVLLCGVLSVGAATVIVSLAWPSAPGGPVPTVARASGLTGGYLSLVLLGLMARIPSLERQLGGRRLARAHALAGRATILLLTVHATAHLLLWAVPGRRPLGDPALVAAVAAYLLLVLAGWASAAAVRRRIGRSLWLAAHTTVYAATALGFAHQLDGPDLGGQAVLRAGWTILYAGVAALLVWYRLVVPVRNAHRHRLVVLGVRPEGPGVVSVFVGGRDLPALGARSGQYFRWRFWTPRLWWTANPYSLSAPPREGWLRITVKDSGRHSSALTRLRPGTRVWAQGPYGGLPAPTPGGKILLFAGGMGITPLRALLETTPGRITLIYRVRRPEDLVFRQEIDALATARGARVIYSVDGAHALPLTTRALRAAIPDLPDHAVYLTGPPGMVTAARRALRAAGVPRPNLHIESFET